MYININMILFLNCATDLTRIQIQYFSGICRLEHIQWHHVDIANYTWHLNSERRTINSTQHIMVF